MRRTAIFMLGLIFICHATAQELDLLDEDEETVDYATATFKTNRVINGHSIETVAKREFDFKISHRFGFLNGGAYNLFGLDQATMRFGGDFGITDQLNIGLGRSTVGKTYDGFVKYKFLRQSTGLKKMPVSAVFISHMAVNTLKWTEPERKNYFTSRVSYTHQLLIARKFSEGFSLQISPTLVHKNLVDSIGDPNDIFVLGLGLRQKLNARVTFNFEYFYVPENQLPSNRTDAMSLGFDIETGGHVFQLFFTNAASPFEKGFLTDTQAKWANGDIRFGFNIARIFNF